jgi:hypothetical protein
MKIQINYYVGKSNVLYGMVDAKDVESKIFIYSCMDYRGDDLYGVQLSVDRGSSRFETFMRKLMKEIRKNYHFFEFDFLSGVVTVEVEIDNP